MKKSILTLIVTFIAVIGFETQAFAQNITFQNDLPENVHISICSAGKTLAAGEVYTTSSSCGSVPCSFEVILVCLPIATINVPCTGGAPYTHSETVPGSPLPPPGPACPGFTVDYLYDVSGNITIHTY